MSANLTLCKFTVNDPINEVENKLSSGFSRANFNKAISKNDLTAIKVHFGEDKNTTFVPPKYISILQYYHKKKIL